jgi:hypothetical protein
MLPASPARSLEEVFHQGLRSRQLLFQTATLSFLFGQARPSLLGSLREDRLEAPGVVAQLRDLLHHDPPTKKLSWATTSRRSSHLTVATIFPTGHPWDAMNESLILLWKKALEK